MSKPLGTGISLRLMATFGSLKLWGVALLAAAAMIFGAELFLSYSSHQPLRLLSFALIGAGVLALGVLRWRAIELAGKSVALLLASGFVMAAAQRYPGLLKEPQQSSAYQHLILGGKVLSFLTAATLAVGAARWLVLSRLKKRAKP